MRNIDGRLAAGPQGGDVLHVGRRSGVDLAVPVVVGRGGVDKHPFFLDLERPLVADDGLLSRTHLSQVVGWQVRRQVPLAEIVGAGVDETADPKIVLDSRSRRRYNLS